MSIYIHPCIHTYTHTHTHIHTYIHTYIHIKNTEVSVFDLGSTLCTFLFTMAMNLLFPAIVVAIVYEKEMKLRVMMRMMGLSSSAYWIIN